MSRWAAGILVGAAMTFLVSPVAAQGFDGITFEATYNFPDIDTVYPFASFTPSNFTVGDGSETLGNIEDVTFLDVNFSEFVLTIDFTTVLTDPRFNSTSFNGPVFTTLSDLDITSVTVDSATTLVGFDASRVLISDNRIALNFAGLDYDDGDFLSLNFAFVPEPASWALMIAGFGLVGFAMRRRAVLTASN